MSAVASVLAWLWVLPWMVVLGLHPLQSLLWWFLPKKKKPYGVHRESGFYGIIITAWKSGIMVPPLVRSLAQQTYDQYHIYVVADQCEVTDEILNHPRCTVIYPDHALNSKSKAIDLALQTISLSGTKHDAAIIFDPDNLAAPDFLAQMNELWQAGYDVIQGRRTAKNLENATARLDGMGESYYNFVNRIVPFSLGGSSAVSGSGMLLSMEAYTTILAHPYFHTDEVIPAEDKFLQIQALRLGYHIAFAKDALVFDEKVSDDQQLERQRTRWIGSYFFYLGYGLNLLWSGITHLSWHWIGFALLFLFPPVVLAVAGALVSLLAVLMLGFYMQALVLAVLLLVFLAHYRWAVKQVSPYIQTRLVLAKLPVFALRLLKALLRIKESKKDFLTTTNKHAVDLDQLPRK